MYYCKNCGYRSQGDFCANRRCEEFCRSFVQPQEHEGDNQYQSKQSTGVDTPNYQSLCREEKFATSETMTDNFAKMSAHAKRCFDSKNTNTSPDPKRQEFLRPFVPTAPSTANALNDLGRCTYPQPACNDQLQIAFATTPSQRFMGLYSPQKAMMAGTIFSELDMPYVEKKILGDYHG